MLELHHNTDTTGSLLPERSLRTGHDPVRVGHTYVTAWRDETRLASQRLRLCPRYLLTDKVGPQSYSTQEAYERLSTARGHKIGDDGRGLTFSDVPRMRTMAEHNDMVRSSRPTSARSVSSGRGIQANAKEKIAFDAWHRGTSLPGRYRRVDATPSAAEYNVRSCLSKCSNNKQAARCSFGTAARFDGGAAESARCRPRSARGGNNNGAAGGGSARGELPSSGV